MVLNDQGVKMRVCIFCPHEYVIVVQNSSRILKSRFEKFGNELICICCKKEKIVVFFTKTNGLVTRLKIVRVDHHVPLIILG